MSSTLQEYIATQEDLLREASEAIPHQFNACTYTLGHIRQAVYLCVTCNLARGICSACSIACHTEHEQLELFPKRNFRCDCPTSALAHPCRLHQHPEEQNTANEYGQNFQGLFCRCGRPYDANNERETMIQCLACEDWFHESCANLRERPVVGESEPEVDAPPEQKQQSTDVPDVDDGASDASSSGLPPPLIRADDYDAYICTSCVRNIPIVKRYAGTEGCLMVTRDSREAPWRILRADESKTEPVNVTSTESTDPPVGSKRALSPATQHERDSKRARTTCVAPSASTVAQEVLSRPYMDSELGTGDVFLTEGFRERWCRCTDCLPSLEKYPFLMTEEETYEAPEDPDSGLSLEELGMRALNKIPRERAIDGIYAFNTMRDNLVKYLRPFAEGNKVVGDEDVKAFFAHLEEQKKAQSGQ